MDKTTRVTIVTGAASGIGFSTAHELAMSGFAVALIDLDETSVNEAAERINQETGMRTLGCAADVTDVSASKCAYQTIIEMLGEPAVLINNAGTLVRHKGRLEDIAPEEIDAVMAVHVGGTLNWSRLVIPGMRAAGFGRIINISSCNAIAAVPYRMGYVTAKKALLGVTEALALETARAGITVNAIAPGYVMTDALKARADAGILDPEAIAERTPVGRWGNPEEIAKAIAFLVSNEASFITGATLSVDGGLTIRGDAGEDLNSAPL